MERGLLRRAQGFLQAAVDLARREGGSGEDDEIEADNGYERGGIAAMYLAQVGGRCCVACKPSGH